MQKLIKEQREWVAELIQAMLSKTIDHCYAKDEEEGEKINKELKRLWNEFYSNCEL